MVNKMVTTNTISSIVSLSKPIELPEGSKGILKKKNALVIIPDSGKKILLFPTDSETVVTIRLELKAKGLSPLFFNELGKITKVDLQVEILYTTGLCFAEERCVWEGFFEEKAKFENVDDIKKKFENIEGVTGVSIDFIKL